MKRKGGKAAKKQSEENAENDSELTSEVTLVKKKKIIETNDSLDQESGDFSEKVEESYEVDKILDDKFIKKKLYYLIRWKGYGKESDSWEAESTLNCPDIISKYKAKVDKKEKKTEEKEKMEKNSDYEVRHILDVFFKKNGKREFLVSWKGFTRAESTWEPEENMDCKELIEKFMEKVERAKESNEKELRVNRKHTDRYTVSTQSRERRLSKRRTGKPRVHYFEAE